MRNLKNDRILSTSKSSFLSNNFEKVEEYHKNLLLFKTPNHRPSEGNNIKLAIRNDKSEVYETLEAEYVSLPTICSLIYLGMAFEQRSSKPKLQGMTFGQISSRLDLTYAPSTITSQKPTERELDLIFEAMYVDYIAGQLLDILRNAPAAPAN
ncbi:hypothetical protein Tco_1546868 [Tanacetum coccineum]